MNKIITQHRNDNPILCPVKCRAEVIWWIWSYPTTTDYIMENTIQLPYENLSMISGQPLLLKLRATVSAIGKNNLGFSLEDISLHSVHNGAIMATYLSSIPVNNIMLIRRWSSVIFLWSIWHKEKKFSNGISSQSIQNPFFYTILEILHEDPKTSCHHLNTMTHNNNDSNGPL